MKIDWPHVSIVAGQEAPFFSPLISRVFVVRQSLDVDARSVRRGAPRAPERIALDDQGGILDPLTGEPPTSEYDRLPTAGERTRMPAVAMRVGFKGARERHVALGTGAYYSNQDWGYGRSVGAWAATADWDVPLGRAVAVSGEFYKGRSIGGLGGGLSASVLFDGNGALAASSAVPIDSIGGWVQLKVAPTNRLEFNGAWGGDRPTCSAAPGCAAATALDPERIRRNATASLNTIYQIRSNVIFSVEYRRLTTTPFGEPRSRADHVSVNTGMAF
jgi:hypothetical protein